MEIQTNCIRLSKRELNMIFTFEKRIEYDLYKRFLKDDNLTDWIDRLTVENKRMDGEPPSKFNNRDGVT